MSKLLYIFTQAPYSAANGQEGLEAMLVGTTFDHQVSALFTHDGIFQIKNNQQAQTLGLKQFTKTFAALHDFDINAIYVDNLSARARGLAHTDLMIDAKFIDTSEVSKLIATQDRVFTF